MTGTETDLYLRLSDGRVEEALEGREAKLRAEAARRGWIVRRVIIENDINGDGTIKGASAWKRKRVTLPNGRVAMRVVRPKFRDKFDASLVHLNQALALHRDLGDQYGQARTLLNLGFACYHIGKFDESVDYSREALVIARELNDRFREGWLLHSLGKCYIKLIEFDLALDCCEGALKIWQETGNRLGEGFTLDALGEFYYSLKKYPRAIAYFEQALTIRREIKDRYGEAVTLNILGLAISQMGRDEKGRTYRLTALRILEQLHAPEAAEIKRNLGID